MDFHRLEAYLTELNQLKKQYKRDIVISTGLEIDYISGFESETTEFLNNYGSYLDDSILSVHFYTIKINMYVSIILRKFT